ncbi:MAG TPA: hypothetical protein VK760_04045 [Candidatus Acidoferrales bacterium]|jgi:hypothetical protein|nr:hypothetical protein [Candidatus Acidoferrales bacterium]
MRRYQAAAAAVALALAGCSGSSGSSYPAGDPNLAAPNLGGGPIDPFLANGDAVVSALDAIAAKAGTPLRVTSMNADRTNGLTVDVQQPANHVNVDEYVVAPDGKLSGPVPVKLSAMHGGPVTAADVDAQAFDPRKIAFRRLAATAKEAIAKSRFPDARVSEWEIDGLSPDARKYIYLDAARGRPVAVIDNNLKIVRMQF